MDKDIKEFCNAAINQVIVNSVAIQWSQDNKISVVQKDYVDILNFKPKMTQIVHKTSFERCMISAPKDYPVEETGIDVNDFLYRLSRITLYSMFLDPLLGPRINICKEIAPEFVYALWSPLGLLSDNQCALLTLTNMGAVHLHIHKKNSLIDIGNLNELWLAEVQENWEKTAVGTIKRLQEQHKDRAYELHFTAIAWSMHFGTHCYLATGHTNGNIALWKIKNIDIQKPRLETHIIKIFNPSKDTVSTIRWYNIPNGTCFIFVGRVNGIIECYSFDPKTEIINTDDKIIIWPDNDLIKVMTMEVLRLKNNIVLIGIKGPYVIATLMDISGKVLCTIHTTIGSLYITGIQHIFDYEYLITSLMGTLTNLKIIPNESETSIEFAHTNLSNSMDFVNFGVYGVACSKSRAIWALLLSPIKVYDHLELKQPASIKFCVWKRFDPVHLLKTNVTKSLTDYWDCMDYVRHQMLQSRTLPEWPSYSREDKIISDYELKILFWLSLELDQVLKRQARPMSFESSITKELYDLINIRHAITLLSTLQEAYKSSKKTKKCLTDLELRTVRNLRDFLRQFLSEEYKEQLGSELIAKVKVICEESEKISVTLPLEKCSWCAEDLVALKCSNSHEPSCCMITLLQISNMDFLICKICERVALAELLEKKPSCIFCDILLVQRKFSKKSEQKT